MGTTAMLNLHDASRIVDEALAYARQHGLEPMTVAALDARGTLVALKMEDGSSLLRPEIAGGKAWSALAMGFGTRNLAGRAEKLPAFFGALSDLARGRVLPVPGGVLLRDGAGTVGASGDVADNDETCVLTGVAATASGPIRGPRPASASLAVAPQRDSHVPTRPHAGHVGEAAPAPSPTLP